MILHRLSDGLRRQHWGTVLMELAIVILGIFLGLRVDDWNEARKLAAEDRLYLERLHADVRVMIENNAADLGPWRVAAAQAAVQSLQDCSLADEVKSLFDFNLVAHQVIFRLTLERATYDEMVATGVLARLQDQSLKQAISRLFAQAETERQYIEYFASELSLAGGIIWKRVAFELVPATEESCPPDWCSEPLVQAVSYDFESLCGDTEFRNAMVELWDAAVDRRQISVRMDQSLRALERQLAVWLGFEPLPAESENFQEALSRREVKMPMNVQPGST